MLTWKYLPLLLPILLFGCAHGIDRNALQERLNDGAIQTTDASIAEVRGLKPQLRLPCRLAVYLRPSSNQDWRWTLEDKAVLDQLATVLKKEGIVADVFPLPELITGKGDVKELRLAAAQCGADALFIIRGVAQTDSYQNFASVFNLTLVGGFVVPGSHMDSLFLIEGALIDVDNGFIYTAMQAEGMGRIMRPSFVIEERESIGMAKAKAVAQFGDEALRRMRWLATTPALQSVRNAVVAKPAATGITQAAYTAEKLQAGFMTTLTPVGFVAPPMPVPPLGPPTLIPPPLSAQPRPTGLTTTIVNRAKSCSQ